VHVCWIWSVTSWCSLCRLTISGNLTGGRTAVGRDWKQVVYRMKMLGFNAIRLPFSFDDVNGLGKPPINYEVSHFINTKNPSELMPSLQSCYSNIRSLVQHVQHHQRPNWKLLNIWDLNTTKLAATSDPLKIACSSRPEDLFLFF
jgi:hypothetical protein